MKKKRINFYLTVDKVATAVRQAFRGGIATSIKPDKADEEN